MNLPVSWYVGNWLISCGSISASRNAPQHVVGYWVSFEMSTLVKMHVVLFWAMTLCGLVCRDMLPLLLRYTLLLPWRRKQAVLRNILPIYQITRNLYAPYKKLTFLSRWASLCTQIKCRFLKLFVRILRLSKLGFWKNREGRGLHLRQATCQEVGRTCRRSVQCAGTELNPALFRIGSRNPDLLMSPPSYSVSPFLCVTSSYRLYRLYDELRRRLRRTLAWTNDLSGRTPSWMRVEPLASETKVVVSPECNVRRSTLL